MKIKIGRSLSVMVILGTSAIILPSLLSMYRRKESFYLFYDEGNVTVKGYTVSKPMTAEQPTRTTYQRLRSAFQLLGYANMTLMKEMEENRPGFEYLFEPLKTKCSNDKNTMAWSMVVVVKSNPGNVYRRQFIRETWGSYRFSNDTRLEVIFVVGLPKNTKERDAISLESNKNRDILQVNKTEEYKGVGLKAIAGMQWVSYHCQSNWLYASSDDDMVPDVAKFSAVLRSESIEDTVKDEESAVRFPIICNFRLIKNEGPIRAKGYRNYVPPEIYSEETYPTFCAGGFYTMSVKICKILLHLSRSHKYFYNDDAWITGLLRLAAIDAGYIPCDDITDERCAILMTGSKSVFHFFGNMDNMVKFWKKQMDAGA